MLVLCEAFIIRFYCFFHTKQELLLAKLSKESMLRIMFGFHCQLQRPPSEISWYDVKELVKRLALEHETPVGRLGM